MNTAGRCAVRFFSPRTLRPTPPAASTIRCQLAVKKFTPRRRLRVNRPHQIAPVAIGTREPTPARVRTAPVNPTPLRLENRRIGQPRFLATVAILPSGLVGRGLRSEEHTSELQSRGHLVCR